MWTSTAQNSRQSHVHGTFQDANFRGHFLLGGWVNRLQLSCAVGEGVHELKERLYELAAKGISYIFSFYGLGWWPHIWVPFIYCLLFGLISDDRGIGHELDVREDHGHHRIHFRIDILHLISKTHTSSCGSWPYLRIPRANIHASDRHRRWS